MRIPTIKPIGNGQASLNNIKPIPPVVIESLDILLKTIQTEENPSRAGGLRAVYEAMLEYCRNMRYSKVDVEKYSSRPELAKR